MFRGVMNSAFSFGKNLGRNPEFDNALRAVFVLKKYNHFEDALKELDQRLPEEKWKELTPTERANLLAMKDELEKLKNSTREPSPL